jgi:hypothetical protein
MQTEQKMRHFSVFGVLPPNPNHTNPHYRNYRENKCFEIVARSALKAVQMAEECYPGIEINSLQHRGAIEIIHEAT